MTVAGQAGGRQPAGVCLRAGQALAVAGCLLAGRDGGECRGVYAGRAGR